MSDTQWPRYEVFQQDRVGRPHRNTGSVHAPDSEMALLNARDVFVRRPNCVSLWVVPAEAVLAITLEELEDNPDLLSISDEAETERETYLVFRKQSQRNSMTYVSHVGEVLAKSPMEAMRQAIKTTNDQQTYVWWVVPEKFIVKSNEEDISSHYDPAGDKKYRMPQDYRVLKQMLDYRSAREGE